MTHRELTRKLRALGCEYRRQAKGSHEIWSNPANGGMSSIPNRGRKDIPIGTIRGILRDLGIDRRDFDSL